MTLSVTMNLYAAYKISYAAAHSLYPDNKATENVEKISRNFSDIFETASNFFVHANCKLEVVNISIPKSFSISAIKSKMLVHPTTKFVTGCASIFYLNNPHLPDELVFP